MGQASSARSEKRPPGRPKKAKPTRAELTRAQADRGITQPRWEKFIRHLTMGMTTSKALDEAEIARSVYNQIIITNEGRREQADIARDTYTR